MPERLLPERLPQVLMSEVLDARSATLQLAVPPTMAIFEGHFHEYPIVPGVAEIDWALHFARERLPVQGEFSGMAKLKFMHVIQPLARLTLTLDWQPGTLAFEYRDARGACSCGQLLFS